MAGPVVHDQVSVQARIDALILALQEAGEGDRVVAADRLGDYLPGSTSNAATMETCRCGRTRTPAGRGALAVSSCSGSCGTCPDPGLLIDADHHGAWRGRRYTSHTAAACVQNWSSSRRASASPVPGPLRHFQASARIRRPAAEIPVPASHQRSGMGPRRRAGRRDRSRRHVCSRTSGPYTRAARCGDGRQGGTPPRANRRRQVRAVFGEQPTPRRSARSPSSRARAAQSWRAAPAPAARTAAARSTPVSPCGATPGPRCPGWLPAP